MARVNPCWPAGYWAHQRRYDAGGTPARSALAVIAEALNTDVRR